MLTADAHPIELISAKSCVPICIDIELWRHFMWSSDLRNSSIVRSKRASIYVIRGSFNTVRLERNSHIVESLSHLFTKS